MYQAGIYCRVSVKEAESGAPCCASLTGDNSPVKGEAYPNLWDKSPAKGEAYPNLWDKSPAKGEAYPNLWDKSPAKDEVHPHLAESDAQTYSRKKGDAYSSSIRAQIQMAGDYIASHSDVAEAGIYADDGVSGSSFDRPEFRRLLADIELGVINMVILKDISRLGREHIDTNYYLGKYFPEKGIRVVSLLDHYDSAAETYDELLEIKTLLNDLYLRDTSKKIRAAIETKRRMGEYTPKEPPFGYVKSKKIRNHLERDAYAAMIVGRIYRMYRNGLGCTVICRILNEDQIPSPAKYKKEILKSGYAWDTGKGLWTPSAVRSILTNPVYTGAVVIRKYDKPSCKLRDRRAIPPEEQEWIPDAHEAIIEREDFEQVQLIRKERRTPYFDKKEEPHKYAGLLFCGSCKMVMRKRYLVSRGGYDGYLCGFHQRMGQNYCVPNHISFEKLDELVLFAVNWQLKCRRSELDGLKFSFEQGKTGQNGEIARLEANAERNRAHQKRIYEQFLDEMLTKDEYLELKKQYENEDARQKRELQARKETEQKRTAAAKDAEEWLELFRLGELTERQLTGEVLAALIDRIYIYPDQRMDIFFKFSDTLRVHGQQPTI